MLDSGIRFFIKPKTSVRIGQPEPVEGAMYGLKITYEIYYRRQYC